ncbi:ferritin [Myxococcaceae bacterium GXIMD 01537]
MAGPPDSNEISDVARIRQVLARELETINEYEAFAAASSHPEVRAFFLHLAAEEKEHVSEATHMLRMLDAGQDAHFHEPIAPGHFQQAIAGRQAATPAAPAPAAPAANGARRAFTEPPSSLPPQRLIYGIPAPPTSGAQPLTVGSLRRGSAGGDGGGRGGR